VQLADHPVDDLADYTYTVLKAFGIPAEKLLFLKTNNKRDSDRL
jgi:hypothetical protein